MEDAIQDVSPPLAISPLLRNHSQREERVPRPSRILVGMFSTIHDPTVYRDNYRNLAKLSRGVMCNLNAFQSNDSEESSPCRIIYTFVIAGRENGPMRVVEKNGGLFPIEQSVKDTYSDNHYYVSPKFSLNSLGSFLQYLLDESFHPLVHIYVAHHS